MNWLGQTAFESVAELGESTEISNRVWTMSIVVLKLRVYAMKSLKWALSVARSKVDTSRGVARRK